LKPDKKQYYEELERTHPLRDTRISRHAIEQFHSRGASDQGGIEKLERRLLRNLMQSQEIFKKDATQSLLNNNAVPARYYLKASWVYVVVDGTLTTCYRPKLRHYIKADGGNF
jgi:CMP-N-acetylneuraminic acid synthetase